MTELKIPQVNANDDSVIITKVLAVNSELVKRGDVLFEFETSKAAVDFEAPEEGYLTAFYLNEGDDVAVNTVVGILVQSNSSSEDLHSASCEDPPIAESQQSETENFNRVSEKASLLLGQGLVPKMTATWLTTSDFFKNGVPENKNKIDLQPSLPQTIDLDRVNLPFQIDTISNRKAHEINALSLASPHPQSTLGVLINFITPRRGLSFLKNSIVDLVLYETNLLLLNDFSDLNGAYFKNKKIIYETVVPGMAMDDKNNLTVVALKDFKTIQELNDKILNVANRFYERKLHVSDIEDTTFTVTDLSSTNVNFIQPLINGLQTFILGLCKHERGYQIFGSFDHRATEGKRFSQFLDELKRRVELYSDDTETDSETKFCQICLKSLKEEKHLGGRGLLRISDEMGEGLICRVCWEGW